MVISTERLNICFTDTLYISFMVAKILLLPVRSARCQGFKWLGLWLATSDLLSDHFINVVAQMCCIENCICVVYLSQYTVMYYTTSERLNHFCINIDLESKPCCANNY